MFEGLYDIDWLSFKDTTTHPTKSQKNDVTNPPWFPYKSPAPTFCSEPPNGLVSLPQDLRGAWPEPPLNSFKDRCLELGRIPDRLCDLAWGPAVDRRRALQALSALLLCEFSSDRLKAAVVPFLLELLEMPQYPERLELLYLLQLFVFDGLRFEAPAPREERAWELQQAEFDQLRRPLAQALPLFCSLFEGADTETRMLLPCLMVVAFDSPQYDPQGHVGAKPEAALEAVLLRLFRNESQGMVRASLMEALCRIVLLRRQRMSTKMSPKDSAESHFDSQADEWISFLWPHCMDANESPVLRLVTSLRLIDMAGERVLDGLWPVILETFEDADWHSPEWPWARTPQWLHDVALVFDRFPDMQLRWYAAFLDHPEHQAAALFGLCECARRVRSVTPRVAGLIGQHILSLGEQRDHPKTVANLERAYNHLSQVGRAALPVLDALSGHGLEIIRSLARDTRDVVESYQREFRSRPLTPVPETKLCAQECLRWLSQDAGFEAQNSTTDVEVLGCLLTLPKDELMALTPAAVWRELIEGQLASPFPLSQMLAARVYRRLGGEADRVLPLVLKQLRPRASGFWALEALRDLGADAGPAIKALEVLVAADARRPEFGQYRRAVHHDESFRQECLRVLARLKKQVEAGQPMANERSSVGHWSSRRGRNRSKVRGQSDIRPSARSQD